MAAVMDTPLQLSMNRRTFVQTASAAAVATAFTSVSSFGADAGRAKLHKGIMYGTIGIKGSVAEKLKAVKDAGFEGIEPMSHMDQDEVLRALEANGLKAPSVCCGTHWAKPLSDANPAVRQAGLDGLLQSLRDGQRYGSRSVLLVPAVVTENVSYAEAWDRSIVEIKKALPLAAESKVKIAIENVWNQFLLSPLEAARYLDEFNSPWIGWHLDIGNLINYGWPEQWVRILGKRIVTLHIKEFSRKRRDAEGLWKGFDVPFLEGDNNWPAVMKALHEIGYDGWGIAEQGGGGTPEGLQDLSTRMDKIFAL
jgi:hexulose-6-phosphate isomerase